MNKSGEIQRGRGIYLLPNLLTTAALFAAFYSIIAGMKGFFDSAAIAIFVAMIADGFDGRVARMTNTHTAFGGEYDSLCDMVSFGVAPALIIYSLALQHLGKIGWLIAFIYTAAVALRLARFNTQIGNSDKRYFQGLPCPPAGAVIASLVWLSFQNELVNQHWLDVTAAIITVCLSILMVSNIRFHSFKEMDLKGRVPFIMSVIIVLTIAALSVNPPLIIFIVFSLFAISGPALTLLRIRNARSSRKGKWKLNRKK